MVPARNEPFLVPTVRDLLAHAAGDVEIIVVLDGYWPNPPLPDDPRVKVIHHGTAQGMRPGINAAAALATGDYLLKIDAHCSVSEGYDVALAAQCEDNWVVIPRRDRLDAERWCKADDPRPPIDAHYLGYPYAKPDDPKWHMHGNVWDARARARADVLLDEEMSSQGSCWFTSRKHWDRVIGPLDVANYGTFVNEFQEIGNKTWCSDGRVMVNKAVTYLHLRKGKKHGRGYSLRDAQTEKGVAFTTQFWMTDAPFKTRVRSLRWLIERFSPVPTWPADLDTAFAPRSASVAVPAVVPTVSWCVPCHKREADLAKSLPLVIEAANAEPPVELVVADYANAEPLNLAPFRALCGSGVSLNVPVHQGDRFHMAHARNVSIKAATGDLAVIASADLYARPGLFGEIRRVLASSRWARPATRLLGMVAAHRRELLDAGGYDERMAYYGPEDKELAARLTRRLGPPADYPDALVDVFPTPDADKLANYGAPLSKRAMHQHGRAIWQENDAAGLLVANPGVEWGVC